MYLRTLLIIIVLSLLAIFTFLNWEAFLAVTPLSLGFTVIDGSLGLILLGVAGALTGLFLIYLVYWQSAAMMDQRRHSRELQVQRELAESAEASRFQQLQSYLESEFELLANQNEGVKTELLARLDEIDRAVRGAIEQSGNSLAAYLGEIEDRLERAGGGKT
ncbi:MAG TPA: LapA family protein [Candidatus Limnocylindria bacterium]|nr:LapA family protein [Candidatus Limnocylindria bacterium]